MLQFNNLDGRFLLQNVQAVYMAWEKGRCLLPGGVDGMSETLRYGPGTSLAHEQGNCLPHCGYCVQALSDLAKNPPDAARELKEKLASSRTKRKSGSDAFCKMHHYRKS